MRAGRWCSSSSTGLEGVNNVFSHVSLILVATFSIFAKLLLTTLLALVLCTCAPMFLVQNAWVSHFLLTKILELTLSCVSLATQYNPSMESPEDIQLMKKS